MITYCVVCGQPLPEEEAIKKAIAHKINPQAPDDPKQSCRRLWRNRWKAIKRSFRVTQEEFVQVRKLRRATRKESSKAAAASV